MRIFIDADGCPVVHETIDLAQKMNIPVTIVKNYAHELQNDYAEIVTVDISRDAADFYIANHLKHEDILVTQDYGLAALALSKKCRILTQNGLLITDHNIKLHTTSPFSFAILGSSQKGITIRTLNTSSSKSNLISP